MYAESGVLFPYFQNFSQEVEQLEDFCKSQIDSPLTSSISDYDLVGEGDLFRAPEPIIEEPLANLDPMAAAMSMISCGNDGIGFKPSDIESFENGQLLSEIFYECKKDLLQKEAMELPFSDNLLPATQFQKSISSGCLSSMEWFPNASVRPTFLDFPGMDFGSVYGMRRAYSEGDIKTLGNGDGNTDILQSPLEHPLIMSNCTSEERKEKLSRYRNKKTKRNFGRKIKYACRKALADSQPRIRGRFAKTEENDVPKWQ